MMVDQLLQAISQAGGHVTVDNGDLVLKAARSLPDDLLAELKAHKPEILAALARPNLSGVSPKFAARLSAEDLEDIATGDIPLDTVKAFEQAAVAREAADVKESFEERAGILEYDAALSRHEAELEAATITATYARNCGYLWASLRVALSAYPELLASLPEKAGLVDSLPLGVSKVAVLSGRRVLRQGFHGRA